MPDRIQPREADRNAEVTPPGPRQLIDNVAAEPSIFSDLTTEPKPSAAPSPALTSASASELLPKLRWANIGWFYHWGTKQYDFNRPKVEIGECIRMLCTGVVQSLPWADIFKFPEDNERRSLVHRPEWMDWENTYGQSSFYFRDFRLIKFETEPDAGIVNFYQSKVSVSGVSQHWETSSIVFMLGHVDGTC